MGRKKRFQLLEGAWMVKYISWDLVSSRRSKYNLLDIVLCFHSMATNWLVSMGKIICHWYGAVEIICERPYVVEWKRV